MNTDGAGLLETAIAAARAGGTHALRNRSRRHETLKTFDHDVKLVLDVECQRVVEQLLRERHPGDRILGEEDETELDGRRIGAERDAGPPPDENALQWIVDPIDGTVNFTHGLPVWCCSVAVRRGARVLAGAVYAPMLDALYTATADGPAALNGEPIRVSDRQALRESIIMTGMDRSHDTGMPPLTCFGRIANRCRKARVAGSAAIDLCWVAQGAAEGYFEASIYLWDIAAAGLIVERAGGRTEVLADCRKPYQVTFLATNGLIHDPLKALLPVFRTA